MTTSQASLVEQVIARCSERRFTGLLRVRALEGKGELSFLSGIRDTVVFDASDGDEALERLMRSTKQEFEAIPRLPPIEAGSEQPLAEAGALGTLCPVNLLRYVEAQSITCTLDIVVGGKTVRLFYEIGELLGVEPETADVSALLEARVGSYRINLPAFELPEAARAKVAQAPIRRASAALNAVQPVVVGALKVGGQPANGNGAAVYGAPASAGAGAPVRADKPRLLDVSAPPLSPAGAGGGPSSATIPATRQARADSPVPVSAGAAKVRPPALPAEPGPSVRPRPPAVLGEPSMAQPNNVARPSVAQPSVAQPSVAQPSVAQPSVAQPSVAQPARREAAKPPSVVVAPESSRPRTPSGPPPLEPSVSHTKGRPEFLTATQPSRRQQSKDQPRQESPAGPASGSLEPWSPASGVAKSFEQENDVYRQSGSPPQPASGSQRYYFWVLLALVGLCALAYFLLS